MFIYIVKKIITIVLILFSISLQAQTLDRIISIGPATTAYKGDLNDSYSKLSGGLNLQIVPYRDKLTMLARVRAEENGSRDST